MFVKAADLELESVTSVQDETSGARVAFPVSHMTGATSSCCVVFEVDPGMHLGRHTDSVEEIVYIVAGQGEAEVGGAVTSVARGDMAVVPPMVPHDIRNTGDEVLKIVGFFASPTVMSTFETPFDPGLSVFVNGAPTPVLDPEAPPLS